MIFKYPTGMIMPFDVDCPTGWTRVSDFDNRFLMGALQYGTMGGAETHNHSFNPGIRNTGIASAVHQSDYGPNEISVLNQHTHSINIAAHDSGMADHTPPYITVIFCKKI